MTEDEVGGLRLVLIAAGMLTTASFLSYSLHLLIDERQKLIDNPEIMPRAVEELWRLESPVQNAGRTAREDNELGGQLIKAGDRVAVFPGSGNRDESIWDNAEQLDVDRAYKRSLVFGDGVHVCLGAQSGTPRGSHRAKRAARAHPGVRACRSHRSHRSGQTSAASVPAGAFLESSSRNPKTGESMAATDTETQIRRARKVVQAFYECGNAGDGATREQLLADDVTLLEADGHPFPGFWQGKEAVLKAAPDVISSINMIKTEAVEWMGNANRVGVLVKITSRDKNGEPFSYDLVTMNKVNDEGKICEIWPFYHDLVALRERLGLD
jgi:ketosteroid isomerase-like protein